MWLEKHPFSRLVSVSALPPPPPGAPVMCRESVLNDAVAIVLYRTLATFTTATVTMGSMVGALGMFFIIFTGSVAIGGILALCLALLFKHTHFRTDPDLHYMETCLVVLVPYMSYTLAEAFSLSGIVSILFCGITMAHYMRPNLSPWSQAATKNIFKTLALLAETFVFVYMVGCPPLLPFVLLCAPARVHRGVVRPGHGGVPLEPKVDGDPVHSGRNLGHGSGTRRERLP